jgi:hypothetical protein
MKIASLGSGDVGQVLGAGFAGLGHQVRMGTREPPKDKVQAWVKKTGRGVSADTFAGAAAFGELAVVATLWQGTESALRLADSKNLAGHRSRWHRVRPLPRGAGDDLDSAFLAHQHRQPCFQAPTEMSTRRVGWIVSD